MTEQNVALTPTQQKALTIKDFIHKDGVVSQLNAALPRFLNPDRFLRTVYSALLQNPKLLDCTKDSLLSAMIQAAQLGLEPVLGKAALIPYGNEMQFQPMFRGLVDLAMRSDKIDKITAHTVYDKDDFSIEYGTDEKLTHKPFLDGDRGNIRGSYTVWYYKDGGTTHSYMSVSDIHKIRDRSQAWKAFLKYKKTCPWNTDESEMCKKTVIKRHSKLQPCSVEFEKAVDYDNSLERGEPIISDVSEIPATKGELLTSKILDTGQTTELDGEEKLQADQAKLEEKRKLDGQKHKEKPDMPGWAIMLSAMKKLRLVDSNGELSITGEKLIEKVETHKEDIPILKEHYPDAAKKISDGYKRAIEIGDRKKTLDSPGEQEQQERRAKFIKWCEEAEDITELSLIDNVLALEGYKTLSDVPETKFGQFKASMRMEARRQGGTLDPED